VRPRNAGPGFPAGNTGALMATARFVLKTLPGIERPAIAKFLPGENGHLTLALDLGANIDCSAAQIVQFAAMGSELVKALGLNANPRVGLLNIGTEEIKGTEVVKQTFALLRQSSLNFVGNVEADSLFSGAADVIAADGFVGNIVLKTIESSVKFMGASIREEFNRSLFNKLGGLAAKPAPTKPRDGPTGSGGAAPRSSVLRTQGPELRNMRLRTRAESSRCVHSVFRKSAPLCA